ncbi:MAG: hypothetical protein ABI866_08605, partial [Dokdonella sp.]
MDQAVRTPFTTKDLNTLPTIPSSSSAEESELTNALAVRIVCVKKEARACRASRHFNGNSG